MSRLALYQKYRSQTFDEVIGQEYIVRSIRNAVKENKVGHAYLFCGPRGTGKTTMARLLARAINCENSENAPCGECENCKASLEGTHPDIIEINAANETHVEDVRDLIERAQLAPMLGRHKIYIIDEVHQLSTSASSALLKTLEEPPEHVIFILATTDPQKLLNTIISRCQRYDFSKVDLIQIKNHLLDIASKESFKLEDKAAEKIAELADGGMRDALSILDQASSYAIDEITEESVNEMFGLASISEKIDFIEDIFEGNLEGVLNRISNAEQHGIDLKRLTSDLSIALKDGVIWSYTKKESLLHSLHQEQADLISKKADAKKLLELVKILMEAQEHYRTTVSVSTVFELACMDMINCINTKTEVFKIPQETQASIQTDNIVPTVSIPKAPVTKIDEKIVSRETKPEQKIEVPQQRKILKLTTDEFIGILVQCNKTAKSQDEEILNEIKNSIEKNRFIQTLRQCDIAASGADCILFAAKNQAAVNMINEEKYNQNLYEYLKGKGIDKMAYAITTKDYNDVVAEFRNRMNAKNLPEPYKIEKWKIETNETEEIDYEEKIIGIFGKENVEILD